MPPYLEEFIPTVAAWGVRVVGVLVALLIAAKLAAWAGRSITARLASRGFDKTLAIFFGTVARWGIVVMAVLSCLSVFGIETTSFAAVIGAAGLAVGLAFQGTLSNFSAGIMLLVFRPFNVGDWISANGQTGAVKEIGLFTVTMDTGDNRRIIIPNSAVFGNTIENITFHDTRRADVDVGTAYGANLEQTREVLNEAVQDLPGRHPDLGHQIFLAGMGASSINWKVRVWCRTDDYWDVMQATTEAVKDALDRAKIGIPYPTMDVNVSR